MVTQVQHSTLQFQSTMADDQSQTGGTVYVVDDDDAVRDSLGLLFKTVGIDVQLFETGDAFLDAYSTDWRV